MRALLLGLICGVSVLLNAWLMQERGRLQGEVRAAQEALRTAEADAVRAEAEEREARAAGSAEIARERAELIRLRGEVGRLRSGTNDLATLEKEVARLQQQLATRQLAEARPPDTRDEGAIAVARGRARSIQCINHLKSIGLAARIHATDAGQDHLPNRWEEMTNELDTPRILYCPAAEGVVVPQDWSAWDPATVTYRLLAPGIRDTEVQTAYVDCPIHGHRVLADGSVQQGQGGEP